MAKSKSSSKKVHKHSKEKKDAKPSKVKSWIDAHRLLALCIVLVGGYILWNQVVLRVIEVQRLNHFANILKDIQEDLPVETEIIDSCGGRGRKLESEAIVCSKVLKTTATVSQNEAGELFQFIEKNKATYAVEFSDNLGGNTNWPKGACFMPRYTHSKLEIGSIIVVCSLDTHHRYY
jgi:cytoskeletal protein RodZ